MRNPAAVPDPPKALIVEDHALMRRTLRAFLQSEFPQCEFHEAEDGASARAEFRAHRPRLVLMDIALPNANGLDLAAEFRRASPGTHVIVVTQHDGARYREHARSAGAFAYVVKDRVCEELAPLVAGALGLPTERGARALQPQASQGRE